MDEDLHLIKFRFTLPADTSNNDVLCQFITTFMGMAEPVFQTIGFEKLNKLAEVVKPHYHIHFATKKTLATIRRAFNRSILYKEAPVKGNEFYSMAEEEDVKDYCRFFRYPWKQGGRVTFREMLPPEFDARVELACSREEYASMVKFNQAKRDKALAPTTCDKIMEYLENLQEKPTSDIDILEKMIMYYAERGSSANKQTLIGYMNTYKVRNKIVTARQMAESWLN